MTDDSRKVRTDVPLGMHPDNLKPLAKALDIKETPGHQAFASAHAGLSELYAGYAFLQDAVAAAKEARRAPPTPHDPRGAKSSHDLQRAAKIAFDRAAKRIDGAVADVQRAKERIAKRMEEAMADPAASSSTGVAVAGEVRAFLRSMKDKSRMGFVYDAIKSDDRRTYNAVVSAPAFLSGMNPKEVDALRGMAARAWAKQDVEQAEAAERAQQLLMNASQMFVKRYSEVMQGEESAEANARRAIERLATGGARGQA